MKFTTNKSYSDLSMKSEDNKLDMLNEHLDNFKKYGLLLLYSLGKFDFKYYEPNGNSYESEINMDFQL